MAAYNPDLIDRYPFLGTMPDPLTAIERLNIKFGYKYDRAIHRPKRVSRRANRDRYRNCTPQDR